LNNLCGVTDEAPAVVWKGKWLLALIRKEADVFENGQFMQCHCILR
jgi:hypothetical protein